MHLLLLVYILFITKVIATSKDMNNNKPNWRKNPSARNVRIRNDYEIAYDPCLSCCQGTDTDCPASCGCSNLPPTQDVSLQDIASLPVAPARANWPPDRQHCRRTTRTRVACPYPCNRSSQCPCWDYCKEKECFLIAWEYDESKYPCVSLNFHCRHAMGTALTVGIFHPERHRSHMS